MTWSDLDWEALDRQRALFLGAGHKGQPYWRTRSDLESYDLTYGERIGWKWDAVLDELQERGWTPPDGDVLDWGCGSGIAGRRVVGRFGPGSFGSLLLWDHSPLATEFSVERASAALPGLSVAAATTAYLEGTEPIGLLIVSHVLNELTPESLSGLVKLVGRARAVIWTEPGARDVSRQLGVIRDGLVGRMRLVAPCTREGPCPILLPGSEHHWCHHFAPPPPWVFADSNWVRFGKRAGIDLRSLPYAFIALDRGWPGPPSGLARVIGRTERLKPCIRLLTCSASGIEELEVMKRDAPSLFKELDRERRPLVYRWERGGRRITAGQRVPLDSPGAIR